MKTTDLKIIDFWGLHCSPCEKIGTFLDELKEQYSHIEIQKIAVHENFELAMKYLVKSVPTLVILKEDDVLYKGNVGGLSKLQLMELIEEYA